MSDLFTDAWNNRPWRSASMTDKGVAKYWWDKGAKSAQDHIKELEGKLHNVCEIYAGMDGFVCETAPEAYQERIIKQMYDAATGDEGIDHEY